MMRVVFMARRNSPCPSLEALAAAGYTIAGRDHAPRAGPWAAAQTRRRRP